MSSMAGKGICDEMDPRLLNSAGNSSGPSSLVTDANSASDPRLQRSASVNNEPYGRLPASPLSFNSNNVSGSPVLDGSGVVQQQGASSATSELTEQDVSNVLHAMKRSRVCTRQENVMQQHAIQQILQRQDQTQLQNYQNLNLQSTLQRQRPPQSLPAFQQHFAQPGSSMQRVPVGFQQQPQMGNNLQQQVVRPVTPVKWLLESGLSSRRLMQYLYHQSRRPSDNSILYWRKFVTEYFAPQAKERQCVSMYDNAGNQSLGVLPQSALDAWQCDLCGSKCGKGFEATFAVLPRLYQIKFDHGLLDEILFLDMPHESRLPTGVMILEYKKAVQESVYAHLRIVREGVLRIIFTPELKIFRWDFCARKHEEFLPRRVLAPQVNQLLQVAQKCRNAAGSEFGSAEGSHQDLQASCNLFLAAGRQLSRNLELQSVNDLGFSKRYVRCLQISEVVSSMKDLIDFSQEHKIGPIESLKNYTRQSMEKLQDHEQTMPCQNLPAAQNTLNNVFSFHRGMSSKLNSDLVANNALNVNQSVVRNNYQSLLRNSLTPSHSQNQHMLPQEISSTLGIVKQGQSLQFHGPASSIPTNSFVNNTSRQCQQQPQFDACLPQNNIHSSQVNQQMQQHASQQMLANNNRGACQPSAGTSNASAPTNANSLTSKPDLADKLDLPDFDSIAQELVDSGMFDIDDGDMGFDWKV